MRSGGEVGPKNRGDHGGRGGGEVAHGLGAQGDVSDTIPGFDDSLGTVPSVNVYDATVGVTVHPMPHDPIGRNLIVRPDKLLAPSGE